MGILETGTNIGVSTSYMALAVKENGSGKITTIEHDSTVAKRALLKMAGMGFSEIVTVINMEVLNYTSSLPQDTVFDFVWLDTELKERFNELLVLYPRLKPGACVCIHDLYSLDFDWFGGVPEQMKELIQTGDLRIITFQTPHGVTLLQKRRSHDYLADLLKRG